MTFLFHGWAHRPRARPLRLAQRASSKTAFYECSSIPGRAVPVLTNYLNASIYGQSTREDIYRALMPQPPRSSIPFGAVGP